MITVTPLASGSSGNAYVVDNGSSAILLDCGISWRDICVKSGWKRFDMCLLSHIHSDHSKAVKDVIKLGIPTYMPTTMYYKLHIDEHNVRGIGSAILKGFGWRIMSFNVEHDVQCLGYSLATGNDKLVYITDTMYCKYRFNDVSHWLIECNYSDIDENINPYLRNRIVRTHMSLDTVKQLLLANDLSRTQEIWLLHLSNDNADAERMRREVQEVTGKVVMIA